MASLNLVEVYAVLVTTLLLITGLKLLALGLFGMLTSKGETMKYCIQVKSGDEWTYLAPSAGEPYTFDTERDAEYTLRMCYPDQCRDKRLGISDLVRVVQVDTEDTTKRSN